MERVKSETVDPSRCFAVIVGVEHYDRISLSPLNDISGPVADGLRFRNWLVSQGVPSDNCYLFFSPLDSSLGLLSDQDNVRQAIQQEFNSFVLNELVEVRGDLLYLYWGGHGILPQNGPDRLRVFFSDNLANLDVERFLQFLSRSKRLNTGFPRKQIAFIDSCAEYYPDSQFSVAHVFPEDFHPNSFREQQILFACSPGQLATNTGSGGAFSVQLIEELNSGDNGLLLNLREIRENLLGRLSPYTQVPYLRDTAGRSTDPVALLQIVSNNSFSHNFAVASKALMEWPTTLANTGTNIPRSELDVILKKVADQSSSTTILLGLPGSGKSALLAELAEELSSHQYAVLAIKCDGISKEVSNPESLKQYLKLDYTVEEAIKMTATCRKVVLILDQLDALSDITSTDPRRLQMLLNVIRDLSDVPSVHIVASCREFEFRRDLRFRIIPADEINFELPPWEKIAPIISSVGQDPSTFGTQLRELLRLPATLNVFLRLSSPSSDFSSVHALFEEVWQQLVIGGERSGEKHLLITELSKSMSDEETLWLPRARADKYHNALNLLLSSGLLRTENEGKNIGFCHQMLFDFALARNFADKANSLKQFVLDTQHRLFSRPTILSTLAFLRDTAINLYQTTLQQLCEADVRDHIKYLLIDFIGAQREPNFSEVQKIQGFVLNEPRFAARCFLACSWNENWFPKLRIAIAEFMQKEKAIASQCIQLLVVSSRGNAGEVRALVSKYWLPDPDYDPLTVRVISSAWSTDWLHMAEYIARRSDLFDIKFLIDELVDKDPDSAIRILKARLDRMLGEALGEAPVPVVEPPSGLSVTERIFFELAHNLPSPVQKLVQYPFDRYELNQLARARPGAFIKAFWPWFLDICQSLKTPNAYSIFNEYIPLIGMNRKFQDDSSNPMENSLDTALNLLAEQDVHAFLQFLKDNSSQELAIVHRLIASAACNAAKTNAMAIFDYLLADPRRLTLGRYAAGYEETETVNLIRSVAPFLSVDQYSQLQNAIKNLSFFAPGGSPTAKEAEEQDSFELQQRKVLLDALKLSAEELQELPNGEITAIGSGSKEPWRTSNVIPPEQIAAMGKAQLRELVDSLVNSSPLASDQLNQLSEYSLQTQIVCLQDFARSCPVRAFALLQELDMTRHYLIVGALLEVLSSLIEPQQLLEYIELSASIIGGSTELRRGAARALHTIASTVTLSEDLTYRALEWLQIEEEHPVTTLTNENVRPGLILFCGWYDDLPAASTRTDLVFSIFAGYARRSSPTEFQKVASLVLQIARSPSVLLALLTQLGASPGMTSDELFKKLTGALRSVSPVLTHPCAVRFITLRLRNKVDVSLLRFMLAELKTDTSNFGKQLHAEALFVCSIDHDEFEEELRQVVTDKDESALVGLAYAISACWSHEKARKVSSLSLESVFDSGARPVHNAMKGLFRALAQSTELPDSDTLNLLKIAIKTKAVFAHAEEICETLIPVLETETDVLIELAKRLLEADTNVLYGFGFSAYQSMDLLTDILLSIERLPAPEYSKLSLTLLEELMARNIHGAEHPLELLDRRPNVDLRRYGRISKRSRRDSKRKQRTPSQRTLH